MLKLIAFFNVLDTWVTNHSAVVITNATIQKPLEPMSSSSIENELKSKPTPRAWKKANLARVLVY